MSKFDAFGREVVGSDWNALQDVPAIITSFAGITIAANDLIVGSGSQAVTPLVPGAEGDVLAIQGGAPTWVNISGSGTDVGQSQLIYLSSNKSVSNSFTTLGLLTVVPGVWALFGEQDFLPGTGTSGFSTQMAVTGGSGTLTQIGDGLSWLQQETSGAVVGVNGNAAYPGINNATLYASITNYLRCYGRVQVGTGITQLAWQWEANNAAGLTVNAGSYFRLTRLF